MAVALPKSQSRINLLRRWLRRWFLVLQERWSDLLPKLLPRPRRLRVLTGPQRLLALAPPLLQPPLSQVSLSPPVETIDAEAAVAEGGKAEAVEGNAEPNPPRMATVTTKQVSVVPMASLAEIVPEPEPVLQPELAFAEMEEDVDSPAMLEQAPDLHLRLLEAMLFASAEPVDEKLLAKRLGEGVAVRPLLEALKRRYVGRGVNLMKLGSGWAFRTAPDLAPYLRVEEDRRKKLSRPAIETLAIIAYHQPVTRAEIESIRGVATSKGTLDLLMEAGWIKPGRRRETPGRPLTWISTENFLDHFGLESLRDLPGVEDLRAAGLLDARPVLAALPGGPGNSLPGRGPESDEPDES
ncbi:segregation and condensation protein B [uncultured Gammaproteobacteria bacterium]